MQSKGVDPLAGLKQHATYESESSDLFVQVGTSYSGRTYEEGKKIGWKDGFRALWCLAKYSWKEPKVMPAPKAAEAQLVNRASGQ